ANVRSYAPVRARLVREPYRRIRKTSGYAGGYLFSVHFQLLIPHVLPLWFIGDISQTLFVAIR
ncbi:hypothetical protein, partial [Salmonella enterica]|uniref:hypothetical protein n=1 Tax=Salmonella enterica TaxID=28901 RepID=UPI0019D6BD77